MNRKSFYHFFLAAICFFALLGCTSNNNNDQNNNSSSTGSSEGKTSGNFEEGKDYLLFERVRVLDKKGFTEPQEAFSLLLPKGWNHEEEIIWNGPGTSCAGTYSHIEARSNDDQYKLEVLPNILYMWNSNPQIMQFNQSHGGAYCSTSEPMDAEQYLKNVFRSEIGNPEIIDVKENQEVIEQMRSFNQKAINELQQYGAGNMQFNQTAVNADVKWSDGTKGYVILGVTILETMVPNPYDGSSSKIYTTQVTNRVVFRYPAEEEEEAKNKFSFIMASIRTNPSWMETVNKYWKDVRQQKHVAHVGRIRMMDEQTRRMGEQAIRNGEARLRDMDVQMRNWEQRQESQDRMHTNFIKAIREVENYADETGKYELSSGYNHAWSRSDGDHFIMSNNPNFDPSSIFQDQRWKEMKKVD